MQYNPRSSPLNMQISRWLLKAIFILAAFCVACSFLAQSVSAQTLTTLYSFTGNADGRSPGAGVIRDAAGNLYGTTIYGGSYDWGTVFKLDARGRETVLYNFSGGADGALAGTLLRSPSGVFYGTTANGGDMTCNFSQGCGTVFKLDANGKETVLHPFSSTTDGQSPNVLIRDAKGRFLGSTFTGGAFFSGTIFELDTTGRTTVLYTFTGGNGSTDGGNPVGVIRDPAGNLFGSTTEGGTGRTGTVFKIGAHHKESILYSFAPAGGADGANPGAGLVADRSGNLYGTITFGGTTGFGTIFKVDQTGKETVLHRFNGADGTFPASTMILDKAGNLYGSALQGGTYGNGTLFKMDPQGNVTILYSLGGSDGEYPVGTLLRDAAGNLYGTTEKGGAYGWGTVFKLQP